MWHMHIHTERDKKQDYNLWEKNLLLKKRYYLMDNVV